MLVARALKNAGRDALQRVRRGRTNFAPDARKRVPTTAPDARKRVPTTAPDARKRVPSFIAICETVH
jgi:hypothetical protein